MPGLRVKVKPGTAWCSFKVSPVPGRDTVLFCLSEERRRTTRFVVMLLVTKVQGSKRAIRDGTRRNSMSSRYDLPSQVGLSGRELAGA